MHSSSKAGFSEATECNVELGPQETRARQIYHNLLEGSISGFWHSSSPDSGINILQHPKRGANPLSADALSWLVNHVMGLFRNSSPSFSLIKCGS